LESQHPQALRRALQVGVRRIVLALVLACTIGAAVAQPAPDKPALPEKAQAVAKAGPADVAGAQDLAAGEAEVKLANRTVAVLRGSFLGVGPQRRAERAQRILRELAAAEGTGQASVRVEPQGHLLLVDGQFALILVAEDADPLSGQTLAQASEAARSALQQALDETGEGRHTERLLRAVGISLLGTLVAGVAVVLTRLAGRWMSGRFEHWATRARRRVEIGGVPIVQTDRLLLVARFSARALYWFVALMVVYQWLGFVLSQFPYTRPWGEGLTRFLFGVAVRLADGTLRALPDLVVAAAILLLARGVIALAKPIFDRAAASGRGSGGWLDADTARPTHKLFNVAVVLFAFVMAYPYLPGSDSEAFRGMSVLVGLMLTLGGSSVVGQSVSGLVLMYSRTLRVGEYVRIESHEGTVMKLGTFTTQIRTGLGEELTLPNTLVLNTVTKNYSRAVQGPGYVVDTVVTIGYDTPWRQVEAMLIEAARRTPGVVDDPAPRVFQTALTDFYPEYRLVCQARPSEPMPRAEVLSRLHARIQDVFNEHGVQIMSPHYLGDPEAAKLVAREDWYKAPARPPG
jgi:small-conductance mechanosensitive channel